MMAFEEVSIQARVLTWTKRQCGSSRDSQRKLSRLRRVEGSNAPHFLVNYSTEMMGSRTKRPLLREMFNITPSPAPWHFHL